jgi:hypothetical protein
MKLYQLFGIVGVLLSSAACFTNVPASAMLYTGVKGETNVTANVVAAKRGEACAGIYLGLVAVGDMSQETAAAAGGITKIATVDVDYMNILGLYQKRCTVVKGE